MSNVCMKDVIRTAANCGKIDAQDSIDKIINATPQELSSKWLQELLDSIKAEVSEELVNISNEPLCRTETIVANAHGSLTNYLNALQYIADGLRAAELLVVDDEP